MSLFGLVEHRSIPQTPLTDRAPLHPIPQIQQSVGNRAVQRLLTNRDRTLEDKLTVGPAHDPYEQEADRVADAVKRMPDSQKAGVSGRPPDTASAQGLAPEGDEVLQRTMTRLPLRPSSSAHRMSC